MDHLNINEIKKLREISGAGLTACKEALEVSKGDLKKALDYLREKGSLKFIKRKSKVALNGVLGIYKHSDGLISVVLLSCETDFAANSEVFKKFANDIALHIVASATLFIDKEDVSNEYIGEYFGREISDISTSELDKMYSEVCLMNQKFFLDSEKTVQDVINELVSKLGEKVEIKYFYKFDVKNGVYVAVKKDTDY